MGNLNILKERKPQACLTKGCYAGCHIRWRGLESHLLSTPSYGHGVLLYSMCFALQRVIPCLKKMYGKNRFFKFTVQ